MMDAWPLNMILLFCAKLYKVIFSIFSAQVLVEDAEDGATYEFACDRWLADDEDDNQIVRELECSTSTERKKQYR